MTQEILVIASFVLSLLMYFGLTPTRLLRYVRTAKTNVTKATSSQRKVLIFPIAMSLAYIGMFVSGLAKFSAAMALYFAAVEVLLWFSTAEEFWGLGEKWGDKTRMVVYSITCILLITGFELDSTFTMEQKVVMRVGIFVTTCLYIAKLYIEGKREVDAPL